MNFYYIHFHKPKFLLWIFTAWIFTPWIWLHSFPQPFIYYWMNFHYITFYCVYLRSLHFYRMIATLFTVRISTTSFFFYMNFHGMNFYYLKFYHVHFHKRNVYYVNVYDIRFHVLNSCLVNFYLDESLPHSLWPFFYDLIWVQMF